MSRMLAEAAQPIVELPPGLRPLHLARGDEAVNENNLARASIWLLAPMSIPIWEALELNGFTARVSGIPPHLGMLTVTDAQVMVSFQTLWGRQPRELRCENRVPYSLRELHFMLGRSSEPSAKDNELLRRSIERLTYATIERSWWDAARGEEVRQVRRLIADADFIRGGRPGQYGRAQRGFIAFGPELFRQLSARQIAYALDLPTLNALSSPGAKRLYLLLAGDQMRPYGGDRTRVAFTYPISRRLCDTLGITDSNLQRVRHKLAAWGDEIRSLEPLYERLAVEQSRSRRGWQLEVIRRRGRAEAPRRRLELRVQAARDRLRESTAEQPAMAPIGPVARAGTALDKARDEARDRARNDPRARAAKERWMREGTDLARSMALREYHRDLVDWIAGGETGAPPAEPELTSPA